MLFKVFDTSLFIFILVLNDGFYSWFVGVVVIVYWIPMIILLLSYTFLRCMWSCLIYIAVSAGRRLQVLFYFSIRVYIQLNLLSQWWWASSPWFRIKLLLLTRPINNIIFKKTLGILSVRISRLDQLPILPQIDIYRCTWSPMQLLFLLLLFTSKQRNRTLSVLSRIIKWIFTCFPQKIFTARIISIWWSQISF